MPNHIIRRITQPVQPDPLLSAQIADAQARGLAATARINAAAFTADVGMQRTAGLSLAAGRAFELSPAGNHVYNALFLAFGSVAVHEVQCLGMQGGRC